MKNKRFGLYIVIGLLVLSIITIITYILLTREKEEIIEYKKGNFYELKTKIEEPIDSQLLTDNLLLKDFIDDDISKYDFNNHNYALIKVQINTCGESEIKPKGYLFEDDILTVHFTYKASCGVCAPIYNYYLLELKKDIDNVIIQTTFKATNDPNCDPTVAYKPIIYIYPEEEQEIEIKLSNKENLLFSYPKYNDGWKVIVDKNGNIKMNNKSYYALFWEGNNKYTSIHEEGFVIEGKDIEQFLEEKLTILGLNDKERNEFIIFWLPKLEQNTYNYIYFESQEEINNYMSLEITPKPKSLIRIQMDYKSLEEKINVKEQKLTTPERDGYTIVEWGGSLIK